MFLDVFGSLDTKVKTRFLNLVRILEIWSCKDVCVIFISAVVASGVIVGTLFVVVVSLISTSVIMK